MNIMHYKGYTGSVKYSEADHCFVGAVLGLERDSITYEGSNIDELRADFEDGIEGYFESCEEIGITPRKPITCLNVKIPQEVHEQIVLLAEQKGASVDDIVEEALLQVAATAKNALDINGKRNKIVSKLPAKTNRKLAIA
jgi:predicted HicB family RNase H-like nuclease